jgi:hypothetical protein
MKNLSPVKTIVYGIVLLVGIALLYKWFSPSTDKIEVTSDVVLEKMEVLGKLELTKLTTKDVLEKKILKSYWVDWFDEKILFIAVGEVAGCIDLTKVQEGDITITEETISIELPAPEICYAKLNHERSRIYDMKGDYLNLSTQKRIEEVYKLAESKIEGNAIELGIIEQTKTNAELIIKPLFETLSGKQVKLSYRD